MTNGPHGFVQGRYGADRHRNFELIVPRGDVLSLYWRENDRDTLPWRPGGVATWGAGQVKAAALCSTDIGDGWLHVLTQEDGSIYHLYRYRVGGEPPDVPIIIQDQQTGLAATASSGFRFLVHSRLPSCCLMWISFGPAF
jgi:hypothetical protein